MSLPVIVSTTILLLWSFSTGVRASDIFSCKQVGEAHVGSGSAHGKALYGDSDYDRRFLSRQKSKIIVIEHKKQINFGGETYTYLPGSKGLSSQYYEHGYWGLIEVYDKRKNEVTLFSSRSNDTNSQKSNYVDIKLWHCNK